MDDLIELKHLFKDLFRDLKEWNEENRNNITFLADCHGKLQEILTGDGDSKEIEENRNNTTSFADCHGKLQEILTGDGDSKETEIDQHQDIDGDIQEQQNGYKFDELNINTIIKGKEEMGKIINLLYQEEMGWFNVGVDGNEYDDDLSTSNIDSSYDLIFRQIDQLKKNNYLTRKRVRKKQKKKEDSSQEFGRWEER